MGSEPSLPPSQGGVTFVRKFLFFFPSLFLYVSKAYTSIISHVEMKRFSSMSGENQGTAPRAEQSRAEADSEIEI